MNHDAVRGFVLRLAKDDVLPDDLTQETFARPQVRSLAEPPNVRAVR